MKSLETVHWERAVSIGPRPSFSRRHLRYEGSSRAICRIAIPPRAVVVSGETTCEKCQEGSTFRAVRKKANADVWNPTHEQVAKARAEYIKRGGVIEQLPSGGAFHFFDEGDEP